MLKKFLIISVIWAILILIVCSIPGSSLPKPPAVPHIDKLVHAGLYFILASFLIPVPGQSHNRYIRKTAPLIVLLFIAFYGGAIEIAQEHLFVNRSGDIMDLLSDIAGGLVALLLYYTLTRRFISSRTGTAGA